MTLEGWTLILGFTLLVAALARPLGLYLDAVSAGRATWLTPVLRPVERVFYGLAGVRSLTSRRWMMAAYMRSSPNRCDRKLFMRDGPSHIRSLARQRSRLIRS